MEMKRTCTSIYSYIVNQEEKDREVKDAPSSKIARGNDSSDTESEEEGERDEESQRRLESGGRDKVAYFFWQGMYIHCTCTCTYTFTLYMYMYCTHACVRCNHTHFVLNSRTMYTCTCTLYIQYKVL